MKENKLKLIIGFLLVVIIVLLVIIIVLLTNNSNSNNIVNSNSNSKKSEVATVVGIYHTYNWNKHEETLELNEDMTCEYPGNIKLCKWTIEDKKISIILSKYIAYYDSSKELSTQFASEKSCEEYVQSLKKSEEKYKDAHCELIPYGSGKAHEATIVNNGLVLHDTMFTKVN